MKFLIPLIALVTVASAYPGLNVDALSDNENSSVLDAKPNVGVLNTVGGNCGKGNGGSSGNGGSGGNGGNGGSGGNGGNSGTGGYCGGNGGRGNGGRGNGGSGNGNDDDDGFLGSLGLGSLGLGNLLDDIDVDALSNNENSDLADVKPKVGALNTIG